MKQKTQLDLFCEWLDDFINYEKNTGPVDFKLDGMFFLSELLGNPQNSFESIHIAGSKGKGSVSTMIASILNEANIKTGIFTSPHLINFAERISTPNGFFSDEIYGKASDILLSKIEGLIPGSLPRATDPTYFELITLFCFLVFKEAHIQTGVFETGMGGRLDATNVLNSKICVITPIELEHTEILGSTIPEIAFEKAGIIKYKTPVIVSRQKQSAMDIIKKQAKTREADVLELAKLVKDISSEITTTGMKTTIFWEKEAPFNKPLSFNLKLLGSIQGDNAAIAALAIRVAYPKITDKQIEDGLSKAWLPARFEILSQTPSVVLDGAHTPTSIIYTLETFNTLWPNRKAHLLFACAYDKKVEEISKLLAGRFEKITITKPGTSKPSDFERMDKAFIDAIKDSYPDNLNADKEILNQIPDTSLAVKFAFEAAKKDNVPLLVTGSFYLVAEIKKIAIEK